MSCRVPLKSLIACCAILSLINASEVDAKKKRLTFHGDPRSCTQQLERELNRACQKQGTSKCKSDARTKYESCLKTGRWTTPKGETLTLSKE